MPSVLLPWHADLPDPWPGGYGPAVSAVADGGSVRRSVPLSGSQPVAGSEVWLVLCGGRGPRGLAGHGVVVSSENLDRPGAVTVDFDLLLTLGEELPAVLLQERVPDLPSLTDGAITVPPAAVPALRRLWSEFLGSGPDPLSPVPGTLDARALVLQPANRYEHDAEARRLCLAYYGTSCTACGLVPDQRYGPGTEALMQVHHLVPGPDLPAGYTLDPVSDLVPLCPTCHTVAHTRVPVPFTPAEVRALLAAAPDAAAWEGPGGTGVAAVVVGSVVTAEQQQALDDAARLRGLR